MNGFRDPVNIVGIDEQRAVGQLSRRPGKLAENQHTVFPRCCWRSILSPPGSFHLSAE